MLHEDNAPIQNTERVQVCLGHLGFDRMDHLCGFFLFGQ
jgi:hypothetical protein